MSDPLAETFTAYEASAEAARAAALARDVTGHVFQKRVLQPWTARRDILFQSLEAHAWASKDFVQQIANSIDQLEYIQAQIRDKRDMVQEKIAELEHASSEPPSTTVNAPQEPSATVNSDTAIAIPDIDALTNWHRFLPSASRVLWLASHTTAEWAPLRGDPDAWLLTIEDWADETISPEEIPGAVRLAHLLRTEHRQFLTLPRPDKSNPKGKGIDPGN
ncbi:hypothetical protein [Prosthecobacter sp.]|uniref:hypothetical protein n=1 Tax=Prosthecobacter sp. TaxID=1965333 RepID=UPI003784C711